ncbi:MAG: DUF1553 domain-containing protein [Planctomycetes bacterium]|nr:DUF1553 domain-containing protein [Planctomycetota bacterium]
MIYFHKLRALIAALAFAVASCANLTAKAADFDGQVAPLLTQRCLTCHNAAEAKGELNLSTLKTALAGGESGPAIVPGNPEASYLLQRVREGEMPPRKKGIPLSPAEIETLTAWVKSGAPWPKGRVLSELDVTTDKRAGKDWWSLQPVKRPAVPEIKSNWVLNPIDAFVLEKLRSHKLSPSAPASKTVLVRRIFFDLTGLPPTPAEIEAFVADQSPDAYEKIVDRLLASPRYGERWGRHWLDVAHYADTHGFERDFLRSTAWPYRDYVIAAFNADKPYNDFIREQIAGDVIAPTDAEKVTATAFLGAGPWDVSGLMETGNPMLKRQALSNVLDDMVTTVVTATQGLTINCARCHNHKFDPILQEDYYRLSAVFAGVLRAERKLPQTPLRKELTQQITSLEQQFKRLSGPPVNLADIVGGGNGFGSGKKGFGLDPRDGKLAKAGESFLDAPTGKYVRTKSPLVDGVFVPDGGAGGRTPVQISSTGLHVQGLTSTNGKVWDFIVNGPSAMQSGSTLDGVDYSSTGHTQLALHANKGITFDLAAIRKSTGYRELKFQAVAGCASGGYSDFWVYVDDKLAASETGVTQTRGGTHLDIALGIDKRFLTLIATDGGNDISHDQIIFGDPLLVSLPDPTDRNGAPIQQRRDELTAELAALKKQLAELPVEIPAVFGVVTQKPPAMKVLARGDTELPLYEVGPGALSAVGSVSSDLGKSDMPEGERRRALADWLVHPNNPLTRRVIVNRLWHYHFGRGIVDTPSDFGFNGGPPTHPELLDYLADELLKQNWSLKAMHRQMVLSNTYRQGGAANPEAQAIDTDNRLLWRRNPQRLEAEAIRDSILAVSGKLNLKMGGPGYRDFQYIERYAPIYRFQTADKPELWRRTVYRFTVRSVSNPLLDVLDCANPSNLTPARSRTTTPLQSLALWNDDFLLRQARYFAERVEKEAGKEQTAQIQQAFRLSLGRPATTEEVTGAAELVRQHGLFHLCRAMFNASEFVYVD